MVASRGFATALVGNLIMEAASVHAGRAPFVGYFLTLPRLLPRKEKRPLGRSIEPAKFLRTLVGATGFEPATPRPPVWCATRLRHAPTLTARRPGRMADAFWPQGARGGCAIGG